MNLSVIVEKFNALQAPVRYGIFGGVILAVFILDYFTLMALQRMFIKSVETKIEKLKTDIDGINSSKQRINQMRQSLESSRRELVDFSKKIRSLSDIPAILDDISRIANDSGVKLDQLMPMKEKQELLTKGDEVSIIGLPITIEAHTTYHLFGRLLDRLEKANLYFSVKDLILENDQKVNGAISARLVIKLILEEKNVKEDPV